MAEARDPAPPLNDPSLVAMARSQPGGWLYDLDWKYPDDQPVPPEAIRGAWKVDPLGMMTSEYSRNERYRPVVRCSRDLKPYMHSAARTNCDQWIVEIDPRGETLFPDIPPELIRGWWYVDAQGVITSSFRPNALWKDVG